jgi:hypothetical protein
MSFYYIALFVHILGVGAFFGAIGVVMTGTVLMRRAQTVEQLRERAGLASSVDNLFPFIVLVLLVPAIYMVFTTWGWTTAWINTALIAMLLKLPLGPAINGRRLNAIHKAAQAAPGGPIEASLQAQKNDPVLWISICVFTGVTIGILFLMTVKPDLPGSLSTMVIALLLAFISGWFSKGGAVPQPQQMPVAEKV